MGYYSGYDTRKELIHELIEGEEGSKIADDSILSNCRSNGASLPPDIKADDYRWERKCLTKAMRGRISGTLYSVWEHRLIRRSDELVAFSHRFIRIDVIKYHKPKADEGGGWGYHPMTESAGPVEVSCPLKYLNMVPDPGGYATGWRERVRKWHAKRKKYKATLGEKVRVKAGLRLTSTGEKPQWVIYQSSQKGGIGETPDGSRIRGVNKYIEGPWVEETASMKG